MLQIKNFQDVDTIKRKHFIGNRYTMYAILPTHQKLIIHIYDISLRKYDIDFIQESGLGKKRWSLISRVNLDIAKNDIKEELKKLNFKRFLEVR